MPSVNQKIARFKRFWGYIVITGRNYSSRSNVHHSVPHIFTDGNVTKQSIYLYEKTSSRSLVVAGATRYSVRG